jgi:hypothetical protein
MSLFVSHTATAQMLVYRLDFETVGETINFTPHQGGFYVAPVNGGAGTLILTRTNGGKKYYTYANFGEMFIALKNKARKAVLTATAANSVSTTTFFAIGDTDQTLDVTTRFSNEALVATELKGYAVSADSERDIPFSSTNATDIGVAGASYFTCRLDEGLTRGAIATNNDLQSEVTELTNQLRDLGYADGNQQNIPSLPLGDGNFQGGISTSSSGNSSSPGNGSVNN